MEGKVQQQQKEIAIGGRRTLAGKAAIVVRVIAIVATVYHIVVLSDILTYLIHWNVTYVTHRATALSLFMLLAFLVIPRGKRDRDRIPWYDIILALLGFSGCAYVFLFYESELMTRWSTVTTPDMVFGMITIITLLLAARRSIGPAIPLIAIFFILYTLFCNHFPGVFHGRGYPWERIFMSLYVWDEGIWGSITGIMFTMVFMFVLFATFFRVYGGGEFFGNLALSLAGRFRGGPAKVSVVSSAIFGTISGSTIANVASDGWITIPTMKRTGYRAYVAGAIEAASSTGGMLMPPVMGAVAFVMADWLQVSYWSVCIAAFLPSVLYYTALYFMVDFEAARTGMKGLSPSELPSLWKTLAQGWVLLIPVAVLIYFIAIRELDPTKAALYSVATMVIVSLFTKETRTNPLRRLVSGLEQGARGMIEVAIAGATIGIFISCLSITGLGVKISGILVDVSGGNLLVLLLLTAVTSLIMGLGLPVTACYILLASLVAPALVQLGVPVMAAHMFVLYYGVLSEITPPTGGAFFVAAAIAGAPVMRTGFEAMRLAIVAYIVPFFFVYNPVLVAIGSGWEIASAAVTALLGVMFLASGLRGYLLSKTGWLERMTMLTAGILLIIPGWRTDLIGFGMAALVVLHQVHVLRVAQRQPAHEHKTADRQSSDG